MRHGRKDYDGMVDNSDIPKGEPVFLLRGQDILAPLMLEYYANQAEAIGCPANLVAGAREQAEAMRDWQQRVVVKKADL